MRKLTQTAIKKFLTLLLGIFTSFLSLHVPRVSAYIAPPQLPSFNKEYYVSPSGNDASSGTQSSPFKTYAKAQTVATSGDAIHLLAGTYTGTLDISKHGLAVIGHNAVIDGTGKHKAIHVHANNVYLTGFEAMHSTSHVVYIEGSNNTVTNLYIHDGIYENRASNGNAANKTWGSGLSIKYSHTPDSGLTTKNIRIDNVRIHNVYGEALDMYGVDNVKVTNSHVSDSFSIGFYIDNSSNVTLENNLATCSNDSRFYRGGNPMGGFSMALEELEYWFPKANWGAHLYNARIVNNISYGCGGLTLWGSELGKNVPNNGLRDSLIAHNTFLNIPYGNGIWIETLPGNSNIRVINNLVSKSIDLPKGSIQQGNVTGVSYTTTNTSSSSFKLQNGKDKGVSLPEVNYDYSGNSRDSLPDAGAWEINGASTTPTPSPTAKPGDFNSDNIVDIRDFNLLISKFGNPYTILDFNKLITNFGK